MKFVTIRELRLKPGDVWKAAQKEQDLIVTSNGKPVAILTAVNEENFEVELDAIKTARALKALDSIHNKSLSNKTDRISLSEINREIGKVRKERKH